MNKGWFADGKEYKFDFGDITTLFTVVPVALTLAGDGKLATAIFIINAFVSIIYVCIKARRINLLVLHIALLVLNVYFMMK